MNKFKNFIISNIVPIVFIIICLIGIKLSGTNLPIIIMDVVYRFDRNAILVLSLIIPILTGMGLNFAIVLGAIAGQIGLIIICFMNLSGALGLLVAAIISLPLALLFGFFSGKLLNNTKGQEMITGMILSFFANGLYQFVFLFVVGGIIKVNNPDIMLTNGVGVRNTIDLANVKYSLDNFSLFGLNTSVNMFTAIIILGGLLVAYYLFKLFVKKNRSKIVMINGVISLIIVMFGIVAGNMKYFEAYKMIVKVPMVPYILILVVCLFITSIMRTKLGQNMRAVGQNMNVAAVAGIDVNNTRIAAMCISTVLAALGQIIFLQNLGNLNTYSAQESVGMFASAAILIGGASVEKATVKQALLGTVLFHLLFNVSPLAGQNLFGSPLIGEYFRVFVAYGVIAVTLALYAWKQVMQAKERTRINNLDNNKFDDKA